MVELRGVISFKLWNYVFFSWSCILYFWGRGSFRGVEAEAFSAGWGCSVDGEVCLLSSVCRILEAERRMKEVGGGEGGSASATLAVLGWVGSWDIEWWSLAMLGHPRECTCSSFLFSMALGSRQEHSSRMSQDMGNGITWVGERETNTFIQCSNPYKKNFKPLSSPTQDPDFPITPNMSS